MTPAAPNPPPNSTARGWRVVSQQETVGLNALGQPVPGMRVSFQTARGVTGSIFIPSAEYRAQDVRAAIAQAVSEIDAVHDLKG